MRNSLVTKVAYLIGVKYGDLFKKYNGFVIDEINENNNVNLIRFLCQMRSYIMKNFYKSSFSFKEEKAFTRFINTLNKNGIEVDTRLSLNAEYVIFLNELIKKH